METHEEIPINTPALKRFISVFLSLLFLVGLLAIRYEKDLTTPKMSVTPTLTQIPQKPRDKIITYTVVPGDTPESIARKFAISTETVKWENNLTTDTLTPGKILRILPVSGVSHVVVKGDTVDILAKKYKTTKGMIIDYPYNTFLNPQTFTLIPGETLIIPNGRK